MANVIDKTFSILEKIVSSSPTPCLPSPLAKQLNLNRATCSRLLKQLTNMGYLVKVSRLQGYAPGPKLLTLNNIAGFERELLDTARPVIDRGAEALCCSMLLARIYGRKRYVLYHRNCSELNIRITQPCHDDLFGTATGLLLTAHLPEEEILACFREQKKLGAEIMAAYQSEKTLVRNLHDISEQGFFECGKGVQWIYAFPVFRNGIFYAALGASIRRGKHNAAYHRKICKVLKLSADEISRSLSVQYTLG